MRRLRLSPSAGLRLVYRRMSLEVKLPLLMSAILAAVLSISLVVTVTTVRRNASVAATDRLARAVHEIVTVGTANLAALGARYRAVGSDSAIQSALLAAASTSRTSVNMRDVRARLASLALPTDSGMPVELWTADGERVAVYGNDVRPRLRLESVRPELPEEIVTSKASRANGDSLRFTALYAVGDRVHFWYVSPVKRGTQTIGYLAHQGRLAVGPAAQRTLRQLSGDSVSLYYRNIDGRFWAGGTGRPSDAIVRGIDSIDGTARLRNGERVVFHEERFASTPIIIGMYLPVRALFARTERNVRVILLLSVILLLLGAGAAWLIGRNVARPLGALTRAAGALAAGDFGARVPAGRDLEVRRLADSFNHMAAELGASRTALEKRTEEAQAANQAKTEFLTMMSHELRTPLNAIGGYVDLLDMGLRGPLTDEQRRDLMRIKASQEHLLGLISAVLDLGRIEAGRVSYSLASVPVEGFLRAIDALIAPQAAAKNIVLEHVVTDGDLTAIADPEKLRQVVLNLLSNAIRYTPSGGTVTLSAESRGGRVAILVEDTGPGIAPDRREMIFEPFVQLDRSLSQTREGLGLGLAISRDLARGMSGDLVAEERLGGGSRFVLLLPRGEMADGSFSFDTGEAPAARS